MTNLTNHKINFTERLKRRHALRFHMSLILLATFSSGSWRPSSCWCWI
ncbi:hypothetical protein [Geotalea toluenoxydans]|nr:hypothetical protein [Geotalea toluenoxydans]